MRYVWSTCWICCLALTACGQEPDTQQRPSATEADQPATARAALTPPAALAEIESRASTMTVIEGESTAGDATTRYRAYVDDDGRLVFVDEDTMTGDYGATRDRFYFVDGRLAYFFREGSQLVAMPPDPPGLGDVVMFLAFNPGGSVTSSDKRLKGHAAALEQFEVTAVARRSAELQKIAAYARQEPLSEGEYAGYVVLKGPLSTFQPCGETAIYWLSGDDETVGELRGSYESLLGPTAGEAAYARLVGELRDPIREGVASHYPAVFWAQAQTALARRADRDCP